MQNQAFQGKPGHPNARQFRVIVEVEKGDEGNKGAVLTAYAPTVRVRGPVR
ncbi:hypothetical protein BH23ACI1_BH23ACI1_27510 [soil metagenome]